MLLRNITDPHATCGTWQRAISWLDNTSGKLVISWIFVYGNRLVWRQSGHRRHASFALLRPSRILHWNLPRSIHTRHQFKPLPQCVAQRQRQRVDVSENDVKWERELLHVGFDFWQFSRAKYRHSDVKNRVFVGWVVKNHEYHEYAGLLCYSNGFLHSLQGETQSRVNYFDFSYLVFHVHHYSNQIKVVWKISNHIQI